MDFAYLKGSVCLCVCYVVCGWMIENMGERERDSPTLLHSSRSTIVRYEQAEVRSPESHLISCRGGRVLNAIFCCFLR